MHLSIILPRLPQYINYLPDRVLRMQRPVHHLYRNFLPLGILIHPIQIHLNVIRHNLALHNHPAVLSHNLQYTYEWFPAPLQNCNYLPLSAVLCILLAGYGCPYKVSVQGVEHIFLRNVDVILPVGNNNKSKPFPCHLNCTFNHFNDFAGGAPALVPLCETFSFFSHND